MAETPTPDPTETLAAWRAVTEGTTDGPLTPEGIYPLVRPSRIDGFAFPAAWDADDMQRRADRNFFATARSAMPRLLAFAEGVLALLKVDSHDPWIHRDDVLDALAEHLGGEGR